MTGQAPDGPVDHPFTTRLAAGYALGSVATGTFGTVPGLLLLPYLTDSLGVGAAAAALVVTVPKVWDLVANPWAGRVSDSMAAASGSRRPLLLVAGLALATCFVLLFGAPDLSRGWAIAWVVAAFLGCGTAYAFFQVPYMSMAAEIAPDSASRTTLMTWRVGVVALAILVSGASAPAIRDLVGGASGYRVMALTIGALLALGAVGGWRGTRHAAPPQVRTTAGTLGEQLAVVAGNRDFRMLLTTYVVQALAVATMLAGVDYLAEHVLGRPTATVALFGCFIAPALVVAPGWRRLSGRIGTRRCYELGSTLMVVGALGLAGAGVTPYPLTLVSTMAVGTGYAAAQIFPMSMLADVGATDARATSENRIGLFTGVWTALESMGMALGPGLLALVLAAGGYLSSAGADVAQPTSAITAIRLGSSVLPAVCIALSLLALRRYSLGSDAGRSPRARLSEHP